MANRTDVQDIGRIQQNQNQTGRNSSLEYQTDTQRDDRFGAVIDGNSISASDVKPLKEAVADSIGRDRNEEETKLPTDPIDPDLHNP